MCSTICYIVYTCTCLIMWRGRKVKKHFHLFIHFIEYFLIYSLFRWFLMKINTMYNHNRCYLIDCYLMDLFYKICIVSFPFILTKYVMFLQKYFHIFSLIDNRPYITMTITTAKNMLISAIHVILYATDVIYHHWVQ